jgi:uncharacterized protein
MMGAAVATLAFLCLGVLAGGAAARAPDASFYLRMRDGVELWTLLFLPPNATAAVPVGTVLSRTPYGTDPEADRGTLWPGRGFAYVEQDQRGSGASRAGDRFQLWRYDGQDGYDTMAWIAAQPWSNGRVFLVGGSAAGMAVYMALLAQPPWVRALAAGSASAHLYPTSYPGGTYRRGLLDPWLLGNGFPKGLPDLVAHEAEDAWWAPLTLPGQEAVCVYPGAHNAGWYDVFLNEQLDGFDAMQTRAPDARCRGQQWLVVEPQGHCKEYKPPQPTTDLFNKLTEFLFYQENDMAVPPAVAARVAQAQALTLFVMGAVDASGVNGNYWTTLPTWPVATPFPAYLAPDNVLSERAPTAANASATYLYDPSDPAPSVGGAELVLPCGPLDQAAVEARDDVLVFTGAPLPRAAAMVGPVTAQLWVATEGVDTDVVVKLTTVYPDGRSLLLLEGATRLRWRAGGLAPQLVAPGEVVQVSINLGRTAYIVSAGHALRVSVASASFPRYEVNANTGVLRNATASERARRVAVHTTVFFDRDRPSHLVLPYVDLDALPNNFSP